MSQPITALVLENEALLRRFASDRPLPDKKATLAAELGRDPSNLNKTLAALGKAQLIYEGGGFGAASKLGIAPAGLEALAALDRAAATPINVELPVSRDIAYAPEGFVWLTLTQIEEDPNNARISFDEDDIGELADSMAAKGLLQKPAVRAARDDGKHRLVAGARRVRAWAMLVQRGTWPADHRELCPVVQGDDAHAEEAGLIENLQRKDLKPLEEAAGFRRLIDAHGHTTTTIAEKIGFTPRMVQQRLQLLQLKPADTKDLASGKITLEEARRRVAAYPKPLELSPELLLVFLEVADRAAREGKDIGYDQDFPVHYAAVLPDNSHGILFYKHVDYSTQQVSIALYHVAQRALLQFTGVDSPDVFKIAPALAEAREAVGAEAPEVGLYVTPWLNAPYDADPEKLAEAQKRQAQLDEAAAQRQAEAEAQKQERETIDTNAGAFLNAVRRFEDEASTLPDGDFQAHFANLLNRYGYVTPLKLQWSPASPRDNTPEANICTAAGEPAVGVLAAREGLRRLYVIAINRACGEAPVSGLTYDRPEPANPPLHRRDFEVAMAHALKTLVPVGFELSRAQALLAEFLDDNGVAYGDEDMHWDAGAAADLARELLAEVETEDGDPPFIVEEDLDGDDAPLTDAQRALAGIPAEVQS